MPTGKSSSGDGVSVVLVVSVCVVIVAAAVEVVVSVDELLALLLPQAVAVSKRSITAIKRAKPLVTFFISKSFPSDFIF